MHHADLKDEEECMHIYIIYSCKLGITISVDSVLVEIYLKNVYQFERVKQKKPHKKRERCSKRSCVSISVGHKFTRMTIGI